MDTQLAAIDEHETSFAFLAAPNILFQWIVFAKVLERELNTRTYGDQRRMKKNKTKLKKIQKVNFIREQMKNLEGA